MPAIAFGEGGDLACCGLAAGMPAIALATAGELRRRWYSACFCKIPSIQREKDIKFLFRIKKDALITDFNRYWVFLNESILGYWPPTISDVIELQQK